MYEVCLARPHAENGEEVGVTREEYERWTKEIRFRMYRCLLEDCPGRSAVILGHHQDDVDENRLDHLMKGHVLGDVEGMWAWREIHGVQLFRPLLHRRKVDFTRRCFNCHLKNESSLNVFSLNCMSYCEVVTKLTRTWLCLVMGTPQIGGIPLGPHTPHGPDLPAA